MPGPCPPPNRELRRAGPAGPLPHAALPWLHDLAHVGAAGLPRRPGLRPTAGCRRRQAPAPARAALVPPPALVLHPPPRPPCLPGLPLRYRSWRERLHIEEATGVGFDRAWSEAAGFAFQLGSAASGERGRAAVR